MLDMISFIQEFENWTAVCAEHISVQTKIPVPVNAVRVTYGAQPIVGDYLDYISKNIPAFMKIQPDIASIIVYDLQDWHKAILQRTAPENLPVYNGRKRCPKCEKKSVLQHKEDLFCINNECQHSWSVE